jgi:hypothetical protein
LSIHMSSPPGSGSHSASTSKSGTLLHQSWSIGKQSFSFGGKNLLTEKVQRVSPG